MIIDIFSETAFFAQGVLWWNKEKTEIVILYIEAPSSLSEEDFFNKKKVKEAIEAEMTWAQVDTIRAKAQYFPVKTVDKNITRTWVGTMLSVKWNTVFTAEEFFTQVLRKEDLSLQEEILSTRNLIWIWGMLTNDLKIPFAYKVDPKTGEVKQLW